MHMSNPEMNKSDGLLSALADEVNAARLALSELGVPAVLEGEPLSLPERIAWLNLTRPAAVGASLTSEPRAETGGQPAQSDAEQPEARPATDADAEWVAETDGVMWGSRRGRHPCCSGSATEQAARETAARLNAEEAES